MHILSHLLQLCVSVIIGICISVTTPQFAVMHVKSLLMKALHMVACKPLQASCLQGTGLKLLLLCPEQQYTVVYMLCGSAFNPKLYCWNHISRLLSPVSCHGWPSNSPCVGMLVSPVLHFSAGYCSSKGQLCTYLPCVLPVTSPACVQVNARKIYDEANVVSGITANKVFSAILIGEAILQVPLALCLLLKTISRCLAKEIASTGMELDVWSNIVRLHSASQKGVNLHICTDSACRGIRNVKPLT